MQIDLTKVPTERLYDHLLGLTPQTEAQRTLQAQALALGLELGRARWLMFEQHARSIPLPFLVVLVGWLALIFVSFGLYAPPNATVVTVLVVCALSVAGAIFLILELDQPYAGWIRISARPVAHGAVAARPVAPWETAKQAAGRRRKGAVGSGQSAVGSKNDGRKAAGSGQDERTTHLADAKE